MRDYTQEELEARYKKLPKPLKDALFDPDIAYAIFDTGKKYGMTIDQIGSIADEVGYVIAGFTRPSEFVENLRERLGAPHDTARDIAFEINHAVFASLREILKSTHQIDISDEEFARLSAAPAQKPVSPQTPSQRYAPAVIPPLQASRPAQLPRVSAEPKSSTPMKPPPTATKPPPLSPHFQMQKLEPATRLPQQDKPTPSLPPVQKVISPPHPPSAPKPAPHPMFIQKPPIKKPEEAPPKKVFVELKDLEEDEIEANIEEERELAAIKNEEDEELPQPEPAFPVPAPVPPYLPAPMLPKPPVIFEQLKKKERQAPSWIREQEERKVLQEPRNGREFTAKEAPPRFTLDLRNKTPTTPPFPVPQKSPLLKLSAPPMEKESVEKQQSAPMATQQKSVPPELESVIKDEDEIIKPPIIKSSEQKPQPSQTLENRQTPKPPSDPYRESIE